MSMSSRATERVPRRLLIPPLAERLAEERPVMTREQALSLSRQIIAMTSAKSVTVTLAHIVKRITQLTSGRVGSTDDGDMLRVHLRTEYGGGASMLFLDTNQLDTTALRELVRRAEAVGSAMWWGNTEPVMPQTWDVQDTYPAVALWDPSSVEALRTGRETVLPTILDAVRGGPSQQASVRLSGFVGILARADAVLTERGIAAFSDETDCEITVAARASDGSNARAAGGWGTGWSGRAARAWSTLDAAAIARDAVDLALRTRDARAIEPGRRTAILGPAAVVQLMRFLALHFNGGASDFGTTGFSKVPDQPKGSRFHEQLFDRRVTITTDPADPDGGFKPWFDKGYVSHPTTWIKDGRLQYLAYGVDSLSHGKPYAEMPWGFRLHGGTTTIEQMISQCDEGIYVNRFSDVDVLDMHTGMVTGVTADGCFLVRNGKIDRPVKNFRFLTSPFFVLNNLMALGPTARASYGYTPWTNTETGLVAKPWRSDFFDWPRRPMVVPPLMVRDFNFSALIDAL